MENGRGKTEGEQGVPKPGQTEPMHHDNSFTIRYECMGSEKNLQDQKLAGIS
jgi:hypothetical protein